MTSQMHFTLVDMDRVGTGAIIDEWDGMLDIEPDREFVVDDVIWDRISHAVETGQSRVQIQVRRRPEPYVIEIWNKDFEEPRRLTVRGEDPADNHYSFLVDAIANARVAGEPLLPVEAAEGNDAYTVEPANTARITLSGPGVHLEHTF